MVSFDKLINSEKSYKIRLILLFSTGFEYNRHKIVRIEL